MSTFLLVSLLALSPPIFIILHTLVGLALMPIYGVDKWRWRAGAIEVMAGRKKDGTTRIWFQPGAQTWGIIVFCANGRNFENEPLQVHERVHVLQSILFGVLFPITYLLSFAFFFVIVKLRLDWWERHVNGGGVPDDDIWHAYRMILWERWAYSKQRRFEDGELVGAWGSFD